MLLVFDVPKVEVVMSHINLVLVKKLALLMNIVQYSGIATLIKKNMKIAKILFIVNVIQLMGFQERVDDNSPLV